VIAVFTKYDQFKREVKMKLEDQHHGPGTDFDADRDVERMFNEHYLANFGESPPFVRLESEDFLDELACITLTCHPKEMHKHGQRCSELIEKTANALSSGVITLMLLAIQKNNLELNINQAVKW
jgi:hypothetical protein